MMFKKEPNAASVVNNFMFVCADKCSKYCLGPHLSKLSVSTSPWHDENKTIMSMWISSK
uniref:Uncharacterized protein n=1 Tax=Meloidogyne incognita TaxID=6306 RepID=A0A914KRB0_MELIC